MDKVERTVAKAAVMGILLWQSPVAVGFMSLTDIVLRFKARRTLRGVERRAAFAFVNALMCAAAAIATPAMAGWPVAIATASALTWVFGGSSHLPPRHAEGPAAVVQDAPVVIDAVFRDKR